MQLFKKQLVLPLGVAVAAVFAGAVAGDGDAYDAATTYSDTEHPFQADGRHEIRFTLRGCSSTIKPKISGTSSSKGGNYTPQPPGSVIVPSDFSGAVYLTGEHCGKTGDACQSVQLTFVADPTETNRHYINYSALPGQKFLFPVTAKFDDDDDDASNADSYQDPDDVIECQSYECQDASRDPDDFISNRIYSSTKGVGVDIIYDCTANSTDSTPPTYSF